MGRVARYKKVKASIKAQVKAGPLSANVRRNKKKSYKERKGKAKSSSDFFDIAPSQGDDFDLNDPTLSIKTPTNNTNTKKKNNIDFDDVAITHILPPEHSARFQADPTISIPKSEKEEAKVARILKTDMKSFEKSKTLQTKENPLNKANRYYHESLQEMKKVNTSTHRHEKRKEYLSDKKKLSRKQKQHKKPLQEDDDYLPVNHKSTKESGGYDPDSAERPPIFATLPKGVTRKKHTHNSMNSGGNSREMEALRVRVQSQYQAMKLKRRKAGDFHL